MPAKQLASQLISTISGGDFDALCTQELDAAVAAVEAGHGKATITIKLVIDKDKRLVQVTPTVVAKIPRRGVDKAMYFVDDKGRLTEEDPKQTTIDFPRKPSKLVKLDGGAGKEAASSDEDTEPKKGN